MPEIENAPAKVKSLMAAQRDYVSAIGNGLQSIIGSITPYQAVCGYNILCQINVLLKKEGLEFGSKEFKEQVDRESINDAIKYAIVYQLNTDNRELFAIVRKEKRGNVWVKKIEVKPQYRGTLKILATYGRDVKTVYPAWIVHEGDPFKYPFHKGVKLEDPEWSEQNPTGKVVRVVVPIEYKNGFIDYRIAERESVATNIKAQIKQSVMFDSKKDDILLKIADMTLDELLTDKTIAPLVNETYTGLSSEEMIITKLVLNAVKRVQIDYSSALARELNEKTFDNSDVYKPSHTANEVLEMSGAPVVESEELEAKPTTEPEPEKVVDNEGVVHQKVQNGIDSLFADEDKE